MSEELPYKTEYAKSGRAGCKGCKMNIAQGTLRLAVMVQVCILEMHKYFFLVIRM